MFFLKDPAPKSRAARPAEQFVVAPRRFIFSGRRRRRHSASQPWARTPFAADATHEDIVTPCQSRSSTRYGSVSSSAASFSGPIRKWRKAWVPLAGAVGVRGGASRGGNKVMLFKWMPMNDDASGTGIVDRGMHGAGAQRLAALCPMRLTGFRDWVVVCLIAVLRWV
jgi:hypothetical protein